MNALGLQPYMHDTLRVLYFANFVSTYSIVWDWFFVDVVK